MSYSIKASDEATFNVPNDLVIAASELSGPTFGEFSKQRFKEDDTDGTATFTAKVAGVAYKWIVHFSVKFASDDVTIVDVEHDFPPGTDLEQDFDFGPEFFADGDELG
ncbi:hypothetical protein [Stutzerimonas nitrititolerans]|uniref:hypothetical protein n=1 Tax=Stutzerimonas nitrititolerans TaxID=2482751 RepID=UPI0028A1F393|nr:hypothetical protein [Stutzerimonas nitrititolerans]